MAKRVNSTKNMSDVASNDVARRKMTRVPNSVEISKRPFLLYITDYRLPSETLSSAIPRDF